MTENKRFRVFKFYDGSNMYGVSDDLAQYTVAFFDNNIDAKGLCELLNELNRLAEGNEEQLLKVMSYLHDKHYDIWEEVNKECFNDRE